MQRASSVIRVFADNPSPAVGPSGLASPKFKISSDAVEKPDWQNVTKCD